MCGNNEDVFTHSRYLNVQLKLTDDGFEWRYTGSVKPDYFSIEDSKIVFDLRKHNKRPKRALMQLAQMLLSNDSGIDRNFACVYVHGHHEDGFLIITDIYERGALRA
jgi:hypothetical protein